MSAVLVLTSAYMGLTVLVQSHMEDRARAILEARGTQPDQVLAIAAPFNSVVWKVIALEEDRYHNLYLSLLDNEDQSPEIYTHPRHPELVGCLQNSEAYRKLDWFSRGYLRAEQVDDKVVVSDLRMGLTPGYVFRFAIGKLEDGQTVAMAPERDLSTRRVDGEDFRWLQKRLQGLPSVRTAELPAETLVAGTSQSEAAPSCS